MCAPCDSLVAGVACLRQEGKVVEVALGGGDQTGSEEDAETAETTVSGRLPLTCQGGTHAARSLS